MWTEHTEYEEYHKLQRCTVFRYQHNNTLGKISSNYVIEKNPQKYRDIIFFQYRTPLVGSVSHLHSQRLDVVGAVRPACEIWQVKLDLVPAVVQPHGHRADEGLDTGRALIVTRPEPPPHVLIVQYLKSITHSHVCVIYLLCDIAHQLGMIWRNQSSTWTSNVKYFLRFLMIITRKGSLMPRVFLGSAGHVM